MKAGIHLILGLAVFMLLFGGTQASAHPGRTDSRGCHTCRTNCPSWGLGYGDYHCHQSKGVPQPEDPIHSRRGNPGYTEPAPGYEYQGGSSDNLNLQSPSVDIEGLEQSDNSTKESTSENDYTWIGRLLIHGVIIGGLYWAYKD